MISDIHGEYDKFVELLDRIGLKKTDTLYILGDILDRGPRPVSVIEKLMEMPNVIPIVGNHEFMAMTCLNFLCQEITEKAIEEIEPGVAEELSNWMLNGGMTTIDEFYRLDAGMRGDGLYRRVSDLCGADRERERIPFSPCRAGAFFAGEGSGRLYAGGTGLGETGL